MNLKNKYPKFSKITEPKFRLILRLFALDLTASDTAKLTVVSIRSVNSLYLKLRQRLADECGRQAPLYGIVELDESYFGAKRIRGKRGCGAAGKVAVSGLLKRNGKVYTVAIPNTQTATLLPIIREQVKPDSIVYTDCHESYDVPDVSEFSHLRINHSTHFAERQNHINGIENFWNQAKRHLRKFNGIPKEHFELYLKECEWRFNNSEIKVQISILKQLVKHDLS